jgi:glycosyltransferase involved in cell wall biosynthesis
MRVFAVIPAYNEASRIGETVERVRSRVDEVIVVDDGSNDGTAAVAREVGIRVVEHGLNRGQGAALRTGNEAALRLGADIVIHVDGDGQHDADCIPRMIEPLRSGQADVVFGSRFLGEAPQGMPFRRRVLLILARLFNTFVMGIPRRVTDPQSGMRAMNVTALQAADFRQDRMAHCSEILRLVTRSNLRWVEVPIRVRYSPATLAKGQWQGGVVNIVWKLLIGVFTK